MNTKSCFAPAHILLPSEQIPLEKWGCIACDQFTSDRDYWQKAEAAAAGELPAPRPLEKAHPRSGALRVAAAPSRGRTQRPGRASSAGAMASAFK